MAFEISFPHLNLPHQRIVAIFKKLFAKSFQKQPKKRKSTQIVNSKNEESNLRITFGVMLYSLDD